MSPTRDQFGWQITLKIFSSIPRINSIKDDDDETTTLAVSNRLGGEQQQQQQKPWHIQFLTFGLDVAFGFVSSRAPQSN